MRLIDADALLEETKKYVYQSDLTTTVAIGIAETWIKNAPTVRPEERRAEWGTLPNTAYPFVCQCTACHEMHDGHTRYCPYCGARMEGMP